MKVLKYNQITLPFDVKTRRFLDHQISVGRCKGEIHTSSFVIRRNKLANNFWIVGEMKSNMYLVNCYPNYPNLLVLTLFYIGFLLLILIISIVTGMLAGLIISFVFAIIVLSIEFSRYKELEIFQNQYFEYLERNHLEF
jgi:hypothetical protein